MFKGPPDDDEDDERGPLPVNDKRMHLSYPKKEACVEMKIARTRLYNFVIII